MSVLKPTLAWPSTVLCHYFQTLYQWQSFLHVTLITNTRHPSVSILWTSFMSSRNPCERGTDIPSALGRALETQ